MEIRSIMEDDLEVKRLGIVASLAASGTENVGSIYTRHCRTLAVSCRVTYNASATSGITLKFYADNEEVGVDTEAFTSFVPTLSAGNTVQRTVLIDAPEGRSLLVKAVNGDATYTATNIIVGYSLARWKDYARTERFQGKVIEKLNEDN